MFTMHQLGKLSELFIDVAKGLFIASFAAPIFSKAELFVFLRPFLVGVFLVYWSLRFGELQEVGK